ncbi:MAG: hypothetical protein ACOX0E_00275 [Syntrophomonadaceae bacterium]
MKSYHRKKTVAFIMVFVGTFLLIAVVPNYFKSGRTILGIIALLLCVFFIVEAYLNTKPYIMISTEKKKKRRKILVNLPYGTRTIDVTSIQQIEQKPSYVKFTYYDGTATRKLKVWLYSFPHDVKKELLNDLQVSIPNYSDLLK